MVKIKTLTNLDSVTLKEWEKLWNLHSDHFFNSPIWFLACVKAKEIRNYNIHLIYNSVQENPALRGGDELNSDMSSSLGKPRLLRRGGCHRKRKILAILPLVKGMKYGIGVCEFPGGELIDKPPFLIIEKSNRVINAIRQILAETDNLYLTQIDDELDRIVNFGNLKWFFSSQKSESPYLPLNGDPFEYMNSKNRKRLFKLYDSYKKDLKFIDFKKVTKKNIKYAVEIDKKSSKVSRGLNSLSSRSAQQALLEKLIDFCPECLSVNIMYYKHIPVIYSIGIIHNKIYQAILTAFDNDFRFMVPGKTRLCFLLPYLAKNGYELINFGNGLSGYKTDLTPFFSSHKDYYHSINPIIFCWFKCVYFIEKQLKDNSFIYKYFCLIRGAVRNVKFHTPKNWRKSK